MRLIYECVIEQHNALLIQTDLIRSLENTNARASFTESTYSPLKSENDANEDNVHFDVQRERERDRDNINAESILSLLIHVCIKLSGSWLTNHINGII